MAHYVFISGGVISGLGKGITAASIGTLLQQSGFDVTIMKSDMYLNIDAGTMNPLEHGEVFVTKDGKETDQDLGHYERFLNTELTADNYLTAGQVFQKLLNRERQLYYKGKCVQPYYHVPPIAIEKWKKLAENNEIVIIELGGTVGEYEGMLFFEAARRLKMEQPDNVHFIHVVYLLNPPSLGEMKTKPAQMSITELNRLGITPDFIMCRAGQAIDSRRIKKLSLASGLDEQHIFSLPDTSPVYNVPIELEKQDFTNRFLGNVNLKEKKTKLDKWQGILNKRKHADKEVNILMAGKYYSSGNFSLEDSYVSVVQSIKIAAWHKGLRANIHWLNSGDIEESGIPEKEMQDIDGIIVPGGFGKRGVEGKIEVIKYAREHKIPYLGLCYGMQLATIEFARHVCDLKNAHTTEVDPETKHPVIHLMPEQEKEMLEENYGGSMRLGNWECKLKESTNAYDAYQKSNIKERHRHRFEFNNEYRKQLEDAGLVISGTTPDDKLVEIVELPKDTHPFFVGTQFHPEFTTKFLKPNPLFTRFIEAAVTPRTEGKSLFN